MSLGYLNKNSPLKNAGSAKGNPPIDFLLVVMASGFARVRVRTTATATTESRKMAAILQLIG